jgi:hypothetical protein
LQGSAGDKGAEAEYMPTHAEYFGLIDAAAPGWPIFLMTDELRAVEAFKGRYEISVPNRVRP